MLQLQGLDQFKQRFFKFEGRSLTQISDWISRHHAGVRYTADKSSTDGSVARFARASVGDLSLVSYRWNVDIEGQFTEDHPALFLSMPISGRICMEADIIGRVEPEPDQLRIYRRAAGHRNIKSSGFENLSLIIPSALLEHRAKSTFQSELNHPLSFDPLLNMKDTSGQAILSLMSYLVAQLGVRPETLANPLVRSSMMEWLVSTVLASWPHNYSQQPFNQDQTYIPVWVKRAEEYMRAKCEEPITVEDLARHAGCSERTLQTAFKVYRHVTPMRALRNIRLERAHEDILHDGGTVTEIAFKWGFCHPARFAQMYAERYGQKPSQARYLAKPQNL